MQSSEECKNVQTFVRDGQEHRPICFQRIYTNIHSSMIAKAQHNIQ
jgi:hypothetical protein